MFTSNVFKDFIKDCKFALKKRSSTVDKYSLYWLVYLLIENISLFLSIGRFYCARTLHYAQNAHTHTIYTYISLHIHIQLCLKYIWLKAYNCAQNIFS